MDNITHTLLGVMVGETAHRFAPASGNGLPPQTRRMLGVGLMVVGNNLPDADFLYSAMGGTKLDYLLQHRGHTHTVVGALLITFLMLAALWLWLRCRRRTCSRADALYLALLALLAPLLHIGLDFTNSYGVHPFWPFNNRWYYGDAVFIIEPLLWACATPLLFTLQSSLARALIGLVLLAGVGLGIGTGMVPQALVAALLLLIAALATIGRLTSAPATLAAGMVAWLTVTATFFVTGDIANARIGALVARDFPDAQTIDLVLTPLPANPFCREVFLLQIDADHYVVRKAAHALAPRWLPATDCPVRAAGPEATAPLLPVAVESTAELNWLGEISMPRAQIGTLASEYCAVRALLRFARVPWAHARGAGWIVGDLRYDREPELAFAEVEVSAGQDECPSVIPGWVPPREDLLVRAGAATQ